MEKSTKKIIPIYLFFGESVLSFPKEPNDPASIWLAKEITYYGYKEKPLEEIISSLLVRENDSGLFVINIPLLDAIRAVIFRRFSAEGMKLIQLLYPSTYSIQNNRIALFTVLISSLAFGVSLFSALRDSFITQNKFGIILPIIATFVLIILGIFFLIKPTITVTYDPSKFNLEMAVENYAKIISKKLRTKSDTIIYFKISIAPNVKPILIKKLLNDLPKFYITLSKRIGLHFRLILILPKNNFPEFKELINENYKLQNV